MPEQRVRPSLRARAGRLSAWAGFGISKIGGLLMISKQRARASKAVAIGTPTALGDSLDPATLIATPVRRHSADSRKRRAALSLHLDEDDETKIPESGLGIRMQARLRERDRIAAIICSAEATHLQAAALHLACHTRMPADKAIAILASMPPARRI